MTFSLGKILQMHLFGESHGECIGVVIEGMPAGVRISEKKIERELSRRRPSGIAGTKRWEKDEFEILSGIFRGKSTGAPIAVIIRNKDVNSQAYSGKEFLPRPGHADLAAMLKFHGFNDFRGGGIFSGRMTAALVIAGAIARQIPEMKKISVKAEIESIGRATKAQGEGRMLSEISNAKKNGDSVGGIVGCKISGLEPGIGEPFFDSIESVLSHAMFSIPAVKGIEFGAGFKAAEMLGSQNNDRIILKNGKVQTSTNNAGGILGGISNGMPVVFRVAIKPVPSIALQQRTVDLKEMKEKQILVRGRHDACIVPRAFPVVENLAVFCIADLMMRGGFIGKN
ncbi:MAG: chorismate synthase [Candidatus Diapherotrites archaeon]|nr:chorismate synthase [Candidatus Diapherotrites archaeon]